MTKREALQIVAETLNITDRTIFTDEQNAKINDALDVIANMREQLSKPRANSPAANEKRKATTAAIRAKLVNRVAPVLRKYLTTDMTAKELCNAAAEELPENFSWQQVQNVLLREMKDEVIKTEIKGKANTYRLK